MHNEIWERWDPAPEFSHSIELKALINDLDTFKILLADGIDPTRQLLVTFEYSSLFYQKSNRALWEKSTHPLVTRKNVFIEDWAFYKATGCSYIQQLEQQSFGFYQAKNFVLFVLITRQSILEVLTAATYHPLIELQKT